MLSTCNYTHAVSQRIIFTLCLVIFHVYVKACTRPWNVNVLKLAYQAAAIKNAGTLPGITGTLPAYWGQLTADGVIVLYIPVSRDADQKCNFPPAI